MFRNTGCMLPTTCESAFTAFLIDCCHFHKDGRIRNFQTLHAMINSTNLKTSFSPQMEWGWTFREKIPIWIAPWPWGQSECYILLSTVHEKCSYSTFACFCIVLHFWEVSRGSIFEVLADNYITFVLTWLGYTGLKYTRAHLKCNLKSVSWKQSHFQLSPKEAE